MGDVGDPLDDRLGGVILVDIAGSEAPLAFRMAGWITGFDLVIPPCDGLRGVGEEGAEPDLLCRCGLVGEVGGSVAKGGFVEEILVAVMGELEGVAGSCGGVITS